MFYLQWYHPILTTFLSLVFLSLCGIKWAQGYVLAALFGGFCIFLLITAVFVVLILKDKGMQEVDTITSFANAINNLDPEGREILADKFPKAIKYSFVRGELVKTFEDTGVPVEAWLTFLKTSNDRYISPLRDWYTADKPERYWWAIKNYLEGKGYVIPDSAAGNHSYLWAGNSYKRLTSRWLMVDRNLVNMSDWQTEGEEEAPAMTPQRVYAYDTPLPHSKEASGGG